MTNFQVGFLHKCAAENIPFDVAVYLLNKAASVEEFTPGLIGSALGAGALPAGLGGLINYGMHGNAGRALGAGLGTGVGSMLGGGLGGAAGGGIGAGLSHDPTLIERISTPEGGLSQQQKMILGGVGAGGLAGAGLGGFGGYHLGDNVANQLFGKKDEEQVM